MSEEPLYQLPDEDENVDTPEYQIDDDDMPDNDTADNEDEEEDDEEEVKRPNTFGAMLKVMIGPVDGWKKLKRAKISADQFAAGCFIPLLVVTALTEFADAVFEANKTFPELLVKSLHTFITYFLGYFIALLCSTTFIPKNCREKMHTEFAKTFIMVATSTLLLFRILLNLLPMLGPVLVFLPIWTIYLVVRGARILRVPKDRETSMAGLISLYVIAAPLFCAWLIGEILP
jgi:hypothetical protein